MSVTSFVIEELDKIARNEGFVDYKIEQEPGSKHGDGFVAKMVAVTLTGKRKIGDKVTDSELHLMCKLLPESLDRRDLFDTSSIFEHEIYVYNAILSVFDQFQCDKNISVEDRFTEYPKCYAAASDVKTGEHVIIMENLRSTGYDLLKIKTKDVDYDTVSLYMNAVGKLHAISFALRDQKPELFDKISRIGDTMVKCLQRDNTMEKMIVGGLDKGLSVLDQQNEIKIFEDLKINVKDEMIRLLNRELAGEFYVLGHGDSWNNNFCYSNEGKVRCE